MLGLVVIRFESSFHDPTGEEKQSRREENISLTPLLEQKVAPGQGLKKNLQ